MKLFDYLFVGSFLVEMRACKMCLGFWVALALYFIFGEITFTKIVIIDAALVAIIMDFLAYYTGEGILRNHAIVRI